jgi:hypothetical protein
MMSGLSVAVEKLRGSNGNLVQSVLSFGVSTLMLLVGIHTDDQVKYPGSDTIIVIFMIFALMNASITLRNRHAADLLSELHSVDGATFWYPLIRGSPYVAGINYVFAMGVFIATLVYVNLSINNLSHLTSSVLYTAMSTINVSKTVRDRMDANHFEKSENLIAVISRISAGTIPYAVVNVVCFLFSSIATIVGIVSDTAIPWSGRFGIVVVFLAMIISTINMAKLIRDDPSANSTVWKVVTVISFVGFTIADFVVPLFMDLEHSSLLFIEANSLWALSSTFACSKILRDLYEARERKGEAQKLAAGNYQCQEAV